MSQPASAEPQPQSDLSANERRAYVRYVRKREARVRAGSVPTRMFGIAIIRQVSITGLGMYITSPVKEGTILEIAPKGIEFPRMLLARVIHLVPEGKGWNCGCELANCLSDEELRLLIS